MAERVAAVRRNDTVKAIKGELDDFLETSIGRAGGHPTVAYVMADVLQWDLDFNRDLRLGDRFELLYEEVYLDGKFHRVGSILTLTYENGGKILEAYRFGEDGGYYDSEGRPSSEALPAVTLCAFPASLPGSRAVGSIRFSRPTGPTTGWTTVPRPGPPCESRPMGSCGSRAGIGVVARPSRCATPTAT